MRIPVIRGVIERRILVNFRVDPAALAAVLPLPLQPKLVGGYGIGGICLIRLREIRPRLVPKAFGVRSENAAHRIAVEWPGGGEGVFVPRRDTSSRLNSLAGGRLFPGVHHLSRFTVEETLTDYTVGIRDSSGALLLEVRAAAANELPSSSVFGSMDAASAFFQAGSVGFSPSREANVLDGLELRTTSWHMEPLVVSHVSSGYFEDAARFPPGSVAFDSAFLMRQIEHEWHSHQPLYCGEERRAA